MKIGDKVRIKDFGKATAKYIVGEMRKYCGSVATILDTYLDKENRIYYLLDVDNKTYGWNKDQIELFSSFPTIDIPKGFVFDRVEGNQIYIKRERLPKTWNECIESLDKVEYISGSKVLPVKKPASPERNWLPKGLGKPMLALMQLLAYREIYRQGCTLDWSENNRKYCIVNTMGVLNTGCYLNDSRVLSFQSEEIRDEFLENFRDLIEEAKDLI